MFILGIAALVGALFLFVVAGVFLLSHVVTFILGVSTLACAWWLANKDWGIATMLRDPAPIKQKSLRTTRYPDRHLEPLPGQSSSVGDPPFEDEDTP